MFRKQMEAAPARNAPVENGNPGAIIKEISDDEGEGEDVPDELEEEDV